MARQSSRQVLRAAVLLLIAVMIWLNIRLQKIFDPNDLSKYSVFVFYDTETRPQTISYAKTSVFPFRNKNRLFITQSIIFI